MNLRAARRAAGPVSLVLFALCAVLSSFAVPATSIRAQAATPAATATRAASPTSAVSAAGTATRSATAASSPTVAHTRTATPTLSASASATATRTPTPAPSLTVTPAPPTPAPPTTTVTLAATAAPTTTAATAAGAAATPTGAPAAALTSQNNGNSGNSGNSNSGNNSNTPSNPNNPNTPEDPCGRVRGNPEDRWRRAFECTAGIRSAKIATTQKVTAGASVREATTNATYVAGDVDLTTTRPVPAPPPGGRATSQSAQAVRRRVEVGNSKYEKDESAPDPARRGWERRDRTPPQQTTAFGPLGMKDGTSIGSPSLYTRIQEQGVEQLPQGPAHKLVAQVNMEALARAGQASTATVARYAQGSGTITVWVGRESGLIFRTELRLTLPPGGGAPQTVQESTVEVTDHSAALAVVAPR